MWSRLAAVGVPAAWPSGALDEVRDAHNGTVVVPPDVRTGVPVSQVTAFRWTGSGYAEIPVQVDERFPYFLANARSDFGLYSATDEELTYAWDVESWKKTAGECTSAYPAGQRRDARSRCPASTTTTRSRSWRPTPGSRAPVTAKAPAGTSSRQEIAIVDPLRPRADDVRLPLPASGRLVVHARERLRLVPARRERGRVDRPLQLQARRPRGPRDVQRRLRTELAGTVCRTAVGRGLPAGRGRRRRALGRPVPARRRDGAHADLRVARDRAMDGARHARREAGDVRASTVPISSTGGRGAAIQQSPDSDISLVGFEDEQANWEANSALLGERTGPGARDPRDVGRRLGDERHEDGDVLPGRRHVPLPPARASDPAGRHLPGVGPQRARRDALLQLAQAGRRRGGRRTDDLGNISSIGDTAAFFDVPDPTFVVPLAVLNWQQVSGAGDAGSLVYVDRDEGSRRARRTRPRSSSTATTSASTTGRATIPSRGRSPARPGSDQRVLSGYAQAAGKPYAGRHVRREAGRVGRDGIARPLHGRHGQRVPVEAGDGRRRAGVAVRRPDERLRWRSARRTRTRPRAARCDGDAAGVRHVRVSCREPRDERCEVCRPGMPHLADDEARRWRPRSTTTGRSSAATRSCDGV